MFQLDSVEMFLFNKTQDSLVMNISIVHNMTVEDKQQ